jgi:type I restriction enzyme, S subunit
MLSVYRDFGVVPREDRDDNFNKPGENLDAYRVVRTGDLVLNKMKTWQGSLGISRYDGIVSPAYFVAEPLTKDDPAFLHHLVRSEALIGEYAARSKGIRPSQWDLPWEEFQDVAVDLPPVKVQRSVADYLDRQTARIDALIAAKRRMVELLEERAVAFIEDSAADAGWQPVALARVIKRIEQGWSPQCDARLPGNDEWGVLKVGCVNRGEFRPDETKALPADLPPRREYLVHNGDLLMSRANTRDLVGSAAVVSGIRPMSLLCDKLYRLRLDERKAAPRFVSLWLQTPAVRDQIELEATGASDSMQNVGQDTVRRVAIPLPNLDQQQAFVTRCDEERGRIAKVAGSARQQISLLQERRQALITAAVTGQLDIPEAA